MARARIVLVFLLVLSLAACARKRTDLLVQGAVDRELGPLLAALDGKQQTHIGSWTFWSGRIGAKSVVISRTEMGPINAAAASALGIQTFRPAAVINQGTCGAHSRELKVLDIVVGEKAIDYSAFRSEHGDEGAGIDPARWTPLQHRLRLDNVNVTFFDGFRGDPALVNAALKVKYTRGKVVKGKIGSAYQFNRELDRIAWLQKTYSTDTEDMESAFAAGVAAGMRVPFVAVRIVSDSEWSHPDVEHTAGGYCAAFALDLIRSLP